MKPQTNDQLKEKIIFVFIIKRQNMIYNIYSNLI